MKLRANKQNLRVHAPTLLGVNDCPEKRAELTRLCLEPLNLEAGVHPSHTRQDRLELIDKVLGNHGVEGLLLDRHGNDCAGNCSMRGVVLDCQYSNTGDTYAPTIAYVNGKLFICDIGYLIETKCSAV